MYIAKGTKVVEGFDSVETCHLDEATHIVIVNDEIYPMDDQYDADLLYVSKLQELGEKNNDIQIYSRMRR